MHTVGMYLPHVFNSRERVVNIVFLHWFVHCFFVFFRTGLRRASEGGRFGAMGLSGTGMGKEARRNRSQPRALLPLLLGAHVHQLALIQPTPQPGLSFVLRHADRREKGCSYSRLPRRAASRGRRP